MSPEERQVLVELFQRTNAASAQPRDKDAEAFIAEAVRIQPYAPYLLAQAVLLQEQAMKTASERLQQLEAENQDLRERVAQGGQPAQQGQGGFLGGLRSLFGGQAPSAPPRGDRTPPNAGARGGARRKAGRRSSNPGARRRLRRHRRARGAARRSSRAAAPAFSRARWAQRPAWPAARCWSIR